MAGPGDATRLADILIGAAGGGKLDYPLQPNGRPDLSGVPAFGQRGFEATAKEFGPDIAMDAAGLAAPGIGSTLAKLLMAAPRAGTAALGALGLTSMPSQAGPGGAEVPAGSSVAPTQENLTRLLEQQAVLQRQTEEARLLREKERKTGLGDRFQAANKEFNALNDRLGALTEIVKQEQVRGSPEHALKMKVEAEAAEAARKEKEANTPFRERYEDIAGKLPIAGMLLAGGIPAAIAARRNAHSFFPGSPQGQVRGAIKANEAARSTGDAAKAALTEAELANHIASKPTMAKELMHAGVAAGSGGLLAAEAGMFPDQYDAFNLPDGPNKDKARERAMSLGNYLERGAVGALTGASGYEAGTWLTPWRGANWAKAKAIKDNPHSSQKSTSSTPSAPSSGPADDKPPLPAGMAYRSDGLPYDIRTGHPIKKKFFQGRDD